MPGQVEHTKLRRRLGLCAYGGCPVKTGKDYRCEEHAAKHAACERASSARRAAKREEEERACAA